MLQKYERSNIKQFVTDCADKERQLDDFFNWYWRLYWRIRMSVRIKMIQNLDYLTQLLGQKYGSLYRENCIKIKMLKGFDELKLNRYLADLVLKYQDPISHERKKRL